MRGEEEIRARIQVLTQGEISSRVSLSMERLPQRCVHNYRHPLDARKRYNGDSNPQYNRIGKSLPIVQEIGLCMIGAEDPSEWGGTICDEPIDAKRCLVFEPLATRQGVTEKVCGQLQDAQWVEANVPEIHVLQWVLGEVDLPRLSWWRRLLLKIRYPKFERLSPSFDSSKLLPPPPS